MKIKYTFVTVFIFIYIYSSGQSIQDRMTQAQPSCREVLINASHILPQLYSERKFDSIHTAVNILNTYCNNSGGYVFYINILLDIQNDSFSINAISDASKFNSLLHDYAFIKRNNAKSQFQNYYYEPYQKDLNNFIAGWATQLLNSYHLTPNESFICNVLAGNYKNPEEKLKAEKNTYSELYDLLKNNFATVRKQSISEYSLTAGGWFPTGHLKIVGSHPAIGFQMGIHENKDELNLTLQFKFSNTLHSYYVLRSDSVYALTHFFGGYIGLDYAHYFFHDSHFEAGMVAGIGYDGFDIADPPDDDHNEDYLKPFSIGSLNINAGIKAKYYFTPLFFIGVVAKFNGINYSNKGGSNLSGMPISIDFIIGR